MNQKFSTLFFLFFILILCSACYTVSYPETCPGLSEVELEVEEETASVY